MNYNAKDYAEKVNALKDGAFPCHHGHFNCAAYECGPCLDHALVEADDLDGEAA